jgi:inorganic pyrophosphatase
MMNVLHPWHGASYGNECPQRVNAVIEIPQGSKSKYEIDKETGLLKLDRIIFSSFHYPVNYGFIPKTLGQDGDPLDILVIFYQKGTLESARLAYHLFVCVSVCGFCVKLSRQLV